MTRLVFSKHALLVLLALAPVACGTAQGDQEREPLAPFELSADEVAAARALAEEGLGRPGDGLSPSARVYFIKVELLPDGRADTDQRKVMVTHYRYDGDETVHTFVDLNRGEVFDVQRKPHFPTALAREEVARAEKLARADARLTELFRSHGGKLTVEARPIRPASERDPLHGRRLALLSFNAGTHYPSASRVVVDLTNDTVQVETTPRPGR
jgi:hypothetical protein